MNFVRTDNGILVGERDLKYLTATEALALLKWLTEQQEWLLSHPVEQQVFPSCEEELEAEWSAAEEAEMRSEDEQIVCFL